MIEISLVIPLLNEEESIKELHRWATEVLESNGFSYEIIFIDDGSTDSSWKMIQELSAQSPQTKALRFGRNFGKSQALHAGFEMAQGDVVITMDADLQDSPEEIPILYNLIKAENQDLVSGWKRKRYDNKITKNLPSKLFNWAARKTSGLSLHDFNCGLKAYRKAVVKSINVSGEMHRYIPVLAKNAGFGAITEVEVKHQARKYGKTKFGAERFINGFLDLVTIWFVSRFGKRPMHLFGALGVLMFTMAFVFLVYLGIDKLILDPKGRLITNRPQFYIALTCMVLGTQMFMTGFLGELLVRSKSSQNGYLVAEKLNFHSEE